MPSLYHFNSDQFKENLMLGGQQHMVAGRLCQYLKGWQLDGLRFLYKHFEKGEACILNDESGLGKVVTVSTFLGAILTNDTTKKCLIIVRDDEHIEGWRFHLSVLTQLTVKVIERTSDINYETVFLIKWSTLKNIGQITKVTFDHVIIDNRGEMLTNKFCTGILLRYYENKTSIVISSADVTADIKLLHILLRLCGRLDKQYTDVRTFEDKFQLPKLKDGVCSKVDLEDYFLKREKVINFCREFRLRRYCHQFDEEFPLVPSDEFKRHLEQWRSSENSQSSGSVKLLSSSSEKDIEELFQAYFQVKEERNTHKLDCEVQQITEHMRMDDEDLDASDEVVIMSPLLFVSESESDNEETQVQTEISNNVSEEVKDEEIINNTPIEKETPSIKNRRKSTKPVKMLTRNNEAFGNKINLRSRNVSSESPSRELKKYLKMAQQLTDKDLNTPKERGRKPLVKIIKDELKAEEINGKGKRKVEERGNEKGNPEEKVEKKSAKKEKEKDTDKLTELEDEKTITKEDKRKSKEKHEIFKKSPAKLEEDKRITKENGKKKSSKLDEVKKMKSREGEVLPKKTPAKLVEVGKPYIEQKKEKEKEKKRQAKQEEDVRRSTEEELVTKKIRGKLEEDRKRVIEEEKEKQKKKQAKLEKGKKISRGEDEIPKKIPAKLEEDRIRAIETEKEKVKKKQTKVEEDVRRSREVELITKKIRASDEVKEKEKKNKEKKITNAGEGKETLEKTGSKLGEEKKIADEGEIQKKEKSKAQEHEKKRSDDNQGKSKEAKEEENKRKRVKEDGAKTQIETKREEKSETSPKRRYVNLEQVLNEAKKFLNNKHNRRSTKEVIKKARTPDKSKACKLTAKSTTSSNKIVSSPKTPISVRKPPDPMEASAKQSSQHKGKSDTLKRGKSLTVYAPLGVHSKSTRGMQRCTRSCPIQNKYMKVALAQVKIDKTVDRKLTGKRLLQRRQAVAVAKKAPPAVESKPPPPSPPPPLPPPPQEPAAPLQPIPESPAVLESMQLGQALTPTNGLLVADFIAPPPKNIDYNFPLMLDKDIPDTECIITSQTSTNNEIIILTGSSTTDNEMEPPKSTVSRRKITAKPPMVTIPRPSYNTAKSPDLFSTSSDLSLPCSQQQNNKSHFEGFKIFGSELRQPTKPRSCLEILERILEPRSTVVAGTKFTPPREKPANSPQPHCIDDEDAMFEITSNGTFSNIVRVNSKGEISPVRNKVQTTPDGGVSHPKNRITNYLISNNQHTSGAPPPSSSEDTTDHLPKTPKRRKSLSGTVKRSPRALSGGISGSKSQSTKLTQWLVKNAVVRISETPQKVLATKRRRLDLSFPDD